jgi:hypothetical protein
MEASRKYSSQNEGHGFYPCPKRHSYESFRVCVRTGSGTAGPSTALRSGRDDKSGGSRLTLAAVEVDGQSQPTDQA